MVAPTLRRTTTPTPFRASTIAAVAASALAIAATSSCGVMPEARYPAFVEHRLAAHYVAPADGRIRVPATTRDVIVHLLELEPRPRAEMFDADGGRWLFYEHGTGVRLRGHFRTYTGDGPTITPELLLPGALRIESLESPDAPAAGSLEARQ